MNLKFINWYTQAIGATLGIVACVYAYINGFIALYSNIDVFFDTMSFTEILASYLLLPLCIITFIFSIIKSYCIKKDISNIVIDVLNTFLVILTVLVGFMGAKIYFLIPAFFILFNIFDLIVHKKENIDEDINNEDDDNEESEIEELKEEAKPSDLDEDINSNCTSDDTLIYDDIVHNDETLCNDELNLRLLNTKQDMALELLSKDADVSFISDITGLSEEYINNLKKTD